MTYTLSNSAIDEISEKLNEFLDGCCDKKDILRFRLIYEEILLKYRDSFGDSCKCEVKTDKRLGQSRLILEIAGAPLNPFDDNEDATGIVSRVVSGLGILPTWSYKDGKNSIILIVKKKRKNSTASSMLIAVVFSVLSAFLTKLCPTEIQSFLCTWIAQPVSDLFLRLVTSLSGPIVFFSVLCGIYNIGDTATFGKIGKTMVFRFIAFTVAAVTVSVCICAVFFDYSAGSGGALDFSELYNIILNIVPNNLFTPFTENNPLQIIFVAIILGVAMLFLGNRTAGAADFAIQLNEIVQLIMTYVSRLIPVFVFISIYTIIVLDKIAVIAGVCKPLLLTVLTNILFIIILVLFVSTRRKVSPGLLLKKIFPIFIAGFTAASSSAVFGLNTETCKNKLGIDKSLVDFGIPLGQVLFMPGSAGMFYIIGISLCSIYAVPITLQKSVILIAVAIILAVAAPPIPGGAVTCYSIIITQMGVPAEAIALCITLDIIFDFLETGVNVFAVETELVDIAAKLNLLNKDILCSQSKAK